MKKYSNIIIFIIIFGIGFILIRRSGVLSLLTLENIPLLREYFISLGWKSVAIYYISYILVCLFSLPGLPMTILGGILFGPIWGTIHTVSSASLGLGLSFLISRYTFRNLMLDKFGSTDIFKKLDQGVKSQDWRIIMITRLIPIFPFSLQNYIYGLTDISFFVYWILSTIFIIPGTAAYTLSVGAVLSGEFPTNSLLYLGIGALCFILLSLIPKFLKSGE
ncbi:MAG: TVP38/TMEM64 family protein [Brevinema sp.]